VAKRTLGRGLSNLLPGAQDQEGEAVSVRENPNYAEVPLAEIKPNPKQPRKHFDEGDISELAKTLHSVGLIEPVVLRRIDKGFQLISGERRWRAARMAGFKKIPAVIKQVNDVQALEMGIIENIQREELTPVEEARSYEYWMQETGKKASDLAELVGKDRTTITNLMRLLKLPEEVLELVEKRMLTPGQARPLIGIGDRRQLQQVAAKIAREGWTARRVEEEVGKLTEPGTTPRSSARAAKKDPNIKKVEDKVRAKLTARVAIDHKKTGAGKLTIHYTSLEELERILEAMKIK